MGGQNFYEKVSKSHYGHENFQEFVEKIKPFSKNPEAWDKFKEQVFKHFDKNGNPIADEAFLKNLLKMKERGEAPGNLKCGSCFAKRTFSNLFILIACHYH